MSRFFGVLIKLSTPAFVLRKVPAMWGQLRRGSGRVEVEQEAARTRLAYRDFPYFDDARYRVLTTASLRALLRICTEREHAVAIHEHARDTLVVDIVHRA